MNSVFTSIAGIFSNQSLWQFIGALSAVLVWVAIIIAVIVLVLIANWRLFTKAGEKGWKCLIPFYGEYVLYKITWSPVMFWVELIIGIALGIIACVKMTTVLAIITLVLLLALFIIKYILGLIFVSKAYGHGVGYFFGLFFLPFIFTLIIAFGKSKYVGPCGNPASLPAAPLNDPTDNQ